LLSRSLEAFAPSGEHWIVVDRADLPLLLGGMITYFRRRGWL
jgi:hypothetical protein